MTITLDLSPELEQHVRNVARQRGVDPADYIVETLEQTFIHTPRKLPPHVSERETALLMQINQSLDTIDWQTYHSLIVKRQAETLTPNEQTDLLRWSDAIEQANVDRMKAVRELAQIRCVPFSQLWQELGLANA
ncbi:MAG: hypothetical protein KAX40_07030 [Herpetosiphon sp.]|nr:hypothetical protein [Herpetosiphon sp.]